MRKYVLKVHVKDNDDGFVVITVFSNSSSEARERALSIAARSHELNKRRKPESVK